MKVAIVGVTGLVGQMMIKLLEERNYPVSELIPIASDRSTEKKIKFRNRMYKVVNLEEGIGKKSDLALFSAGGEISLEYVPQFVKKGTIVIDNSSAWRMDPDVKLIVPEINGDLISENDTIIANPNCSTIQMVMVLAPLHRQYAIKRIVISTYQAVSGTGSGAVMQLENERAGIEGKMSYPYVIDKNCLPHCDDFIENGYTKEEMKLINETNKILDDSLNITATAVRVPVLRGHSESVNVEFHNDFDEQDIRDILVEAPGIVVLDNPQRNKYPMPLISEDSDAVFVGRIRRDYSVANALNLWIVADNLRKGAATNAVQISEYLHQKKLV